MLIQEVVQRTGFSKDTIRYYEKIGLIKILKKERRYNNYKEYSEEIVQSLQIIKRAKHLGFTLAEIKENLNPWLHKSLTKIERIDLFNSRITLINQKIKNLQEIKFFLKARIEQIHKE